MAKKKDARVKRKGRPDDLREACVVEALAIVGDSGLEALSLREVARRLHVSHQAPYKHYPSRDHLLAEVVARAYAAFARHLDDRPRRDDPFDDLGEMGLAYVGYALVHPLHYRLMFGTPLPDPDQHPEMLKEARHAFALLLDAVAKLGPDPASRPPPELDALYVWATVHGLATILQSSALTTLPVTPSMLVGMESHVMNRLRAALTAAIDTARGSGKPG